MAAHADSKSRASLFTVPSTRQSDIRLADKLDPKQPAAIADWLIEFIGALNTEERELVVGKLAEEKDGKAVAKKYKISPPKGMTAFSKQEESELHAEYTRWRDTVLRNVASSLMRSINWNKHAALRTFVRHGDSNRGIDAIQVSYDGAELYHYVLEMGDKSKPHAQTGLQRDWAHVCIAAYCPATQVKPFTIFTDIDTHEAVETKLHALLENYESNNTLAAMGPDSFIDVVVRLLQAEVPVLKEWANGKRSDAAEAGGYAYATRLEFVQAVMMMLPELVPSAQPLYKSALDPGVEAGLNAMASGRPGQDQGNRLRLQRPSGAQAPRPRPPFNACVFCDCRACPNTSNKQELCCVFGGKRVALKQGATQDEHNFRDTNVSFLARHKEYAKPPYLKGMLARKHLNDFTKLAAQR